MKRCFTCKEEKNTSEFYKDNTRKDGFVSNCKICYKKARKQREEHNPIYGEKARLRVKRWYQNNKKEFSKKMKIYHSLEKNKVKCRASAILRQYIYVGKIKKPTVCSICGKENKIIHGHHPNYSKPLEVRWLCPRCHNNINRRSIQV